MAIIQLPEYIYTGIDSISHIFDRECKKILILSNTEVQKSTSILADILKKAKKHSIKTNLIISDNPSEMFTAIEENMLDELPEIIVAVGDGKTIDCAMVASSMSGIPYCAAPQSAPTVLWENDSVEALVNKKVPLICILDPDMITRLNSVRIAYEGLGMLTICAESFLTAEDRYIKSVAKAAFKRIYGNLFEAFKGEISARENLLDGMFWAYVAFVNSHEFSWESACYRFCDFLKPSGIDPISLLAVSSVQIIKNIYSENEYLLNELACETGASVQRELSSMYLVENIRRMRAAMSVPSCVKNLGVQEDCFLRMSEEISEEDRRLFAECYYSDYCSKTNIDRVFIRS